MSTALYRGFVRVLESWPVDKTRTGRDIGEKLRKQLAGWFPHGENSSVDLRHFQQQLDSLKRISSNHHLTKNVRNGNRTASGFTLNECRHMMTNETLQMLEEMNKTTWGRLKLTFKSLRK